MKAYLMSFDGKPKTTVFYDGGCRLCAAEIRHYARLDRGRRLELIDFTQDPVLLSAMGVSHDEAMRRLHALDHNGIMVDGARAFLAIWSELPYYRLVAKAVYATGSITWLEKCYSRFAVWRYARRCENQVCAALTQRHGMPESTTE